MWTHCQNFEALPKESSLLKAKLVETENKRNKLMTEKKDLIEAHKSTEHKVFEREAFDSENRF